MDVSTNQQPSSGQAPDGRTRSRRGPRFWPLLQKELRETLRDRRTIATLFLMPLLVYPILSLLLQNFLPRQLDGADPVRFRIVMKASSQLEPFLERVGLADRSLRSDAVEGAVSQALKLEELPLLEASDPTSKPSGKTANENGLPIPNRVYPEDLNVLEHQWNVYEGERPLEDLVSEGSFDLGIQFVNVDGLSQQRRRDERLRGKKVVLIYNRDLEYSRRAAQYVAIRMERFNLLESQVTRDGRWQWNDQALGRTMKAIASTATSPLTGFATFLPLILIMMTITGAVYPAIDLTAGERERGTLESLVAAPVSRIGVLFAKYVAVWVVAMLTAILNIASMLTTMWVFQLDKVLLSDGITLLLIVQILLLLALYALFFSAILLVLTSIARSFKEAQAYLIPLMMFSIAPGVLAMMPELGSGLWLAMVPMVNLVLLARDVMQAEANGVFATISVVTTLLYSAAALAMAANLFGSDAVLYGSQGGWRDLLRSSDRQRVPTPAFALLVLSLLFPAQFLLLGVMGRMREIWTPLQTVSAIGVGTTALFLILPAGLVALRRYNFRQTFALRWPGFGALFGGMLLGLGAWPFVGLGLWFLGNVYEAAAGGQAGGDWTQRLTEMAVAQVEGWSEIPLPILVLVLAVLPAICEEFFFRGLLLQSLARRMSPLRAILLSGLAFGLFHFIVESSVAPLRFVVTSTMGFLLAWVCLKSNSLMPGVVLHSINNGILTTVGLMREKLVQQDSIQQPAALQIAMVLSVALFLLVLGGWLMKDRTGRLTPKMAPGALLWGLLWVSVGIIGTASVADAFPQAIPATATEAAEDPDLPQVADGWKIQRYADDELAHDIHSLAVGPQGQVFVSGPGYVAQLVDSDQDGVADQRRRLPFSPGQGAQGLLVEADNLWVVADRAIWKVPRDGSPARSFLQLPKTGGEHDFHALRRGSDGFLYFIAGNYSGIDQSFVTHPAPIPRPRHGVLGRISPDGRLRQILVDGMRNSYDFDFSLDGSFLIYDSDDERDSGLPWYRPTTLFSAREGQTIGWVSRCFKQPAGVLGSAEVRAETGRGSPTGVATLHHLGWGWPWVGSVVFADWTFGRVYLQAHPTIANGAAPVLLVASRNGVAFAPTDLAFDSEGNLFICTGGRDTTGAVYRVWRPEPATQVDRFPKGDAQDLLASILNATTDPAGEQVDWESVTAQLNQLVDQSQPGTPFQALALDLLRSRLRTRALEPTLNAGQVEQLQQKIPADLPPITAAWKADLATWLAINPPVPKVPLTIAQQATVKRRSEMMICMSENQLFQILNGNQFDAETRKATVGALARQRSSVLAVDTAVNLLADDLQKIADGDSTSLSCWDWLVIMRWALQSPVPNDGETSPWDFMKRGRSISEARRDATRLDQRFESAWATEFAANEPEADSSLAVLKLELLLEVDPAIILKQWQQWDERFGRRIDPVQRIDSLVVLAAIEQSYPPEIRNSVCDFLLNIDRELEQAEVSIDNNWSDRFQAIGRLLLRDRETAEQLMQAAGWQRPSQLPTLKLLQPLQQQEPLRKMAESWDQWAANKVSTDFLANLQQVTRLWQVSRGRLPATQQQQIDTLTADVNSFESRVQEERSAYLAQLKSELAGADRSQQTSDELVEQVNWSVGDPKRGQQLYEALNCQRCHAKTGRLGPSLAGVTRRFSRPDLVEAMIRPSANVNDRYRTTLVRTVDGRLLSGIPVYNSTDGLILEDADGKTWQLSREDIEESRESDQSLMPEGLMNRASDQDWADLFRYLETL